MLILDSLPPPLSSARITSGGSGGPKLAESVKSASSVDQSSFRLFLDAHP